MADTWNWGSKKSRFLGKWTQDFLMFQWKAKRSQLQRTGKISLKSNKPLQSRTKMLNNIIVIIFSPLFYKVLHATNTRTHNLNVNQETA